jgi:hypothetical protein
VDPAKDRARARTYGDFPDALVPLIGYGGENVANSIQPAKDRALAFWVDVFIPPDAAAGAYAGRIVLKQGDAEAAAVAVRLQVRDVGIPADSTLPSLFNLRLHPHVRANLDRYVEEALWHRVAPTNYHYVDYCLKDGFELMDRYNPGGRGFVNVYYWLTKKPEGRQADELVSGLRKVTAHLKDRKLFDRAYLYLTDEPAKKDIPGVVEAAGLILKEVPEWKGKLLCTVCSEGTDLDALLTYQARALKVYGKWYAQLPPFPAGREEWDKRRADGKQLWFYVSNAQGVPYPTFDVNTVNLAFEPRVLGWAYWYEKADGHLYWDLMFEPKWELHRKFPPGDGQLIYPGDFSLQGAPPGPW